MEEQGEEEERHMQMQRHQESMQEKSKFMTTMMMLMHNLDQTMRTPPIVHQHYPIVKPGTQMRENMIGNMNVGSVEEMNKESDEVGGSEMYMTDGSLINLGIFCVQRNKFKCKFNYVNKFLVQTPQLNHP